MKPMQTWDELFKYTTRTRRVEAVPRVKDIDHVPRGLRNRTPQPRHIVHQYEIRGGITLQHLMAQNISAYNSLLRWMTSK